MNPPTNIDPRPFTGGRHRDALTSDHFEVRNPYSGQLISQVPACGKADVDRAVDSARKMVSSGDWSRRPPAERALVLRRIADLVEAHGDELAALDSLQVGIPISVTRDDIGLAARKLRDVANRVEVFSEQALPCKTGFRHLNQRHPHGVVAAITPWNFPLFVALGKVGPALAAGNAVVLKPSEVAPLACLRLGLLALEAGLPEGALHILPGMGGDAGQALAEHPGVDMLSFTGSTATGRLLMRAAATSNLKALHLELGGKSPQVVLDDLGDIEALAQRLADGFTFNSGQVCVAGSRLLIHRSLASALLPLVAEKASQQVVGDPMDPATTLGPIATPSLRERIQGFIDEARFNGFTEHRVGPELAAPFIQPRLFSDVPVDARLMQEEVFGPVAAALTFDTPEEAAMLANSTRYGLAATVWGSDFRAASRLADQVRSGHVSVITALNTGASGVRGVAQEPFGESGFGVEGGDAGLLAFSRARHLAITQG